MRGLIAALMCLALAACQTAPVLPPPDTAKVVVEEHNAHNDHSTRTFFPDDRALIEFSFEGGTPNKPVWLAAAPDRFAQAQAVVVALFAKGVKAGRNVVCSSSEHDPPLIRITYRDPAGKEQVAAGCGNPDIIAAEEALIGVLNGRGN